jgi:hypothetical protein
MTTRMPRYLGFYAVLLIYACCWFLSRSPLFVQAPHRLSLAMLGDLLFTAPAAYVLLSSRKKNWLLLLGRLFMVGLLIASLVLASYPNSYLQILRTWVAPLLELALIGSVVYALRKQYRLATQVSVVHPDFLVQCREVLSRMIGQETVARVLAGELALFYYLMGIREPIQPGEHRFTTFRSNGSRLVLQCFVGLFIVETAGMHLLLRLWSPGLATIITLLGVYSCLQLLAHIRSLSTRGTVVNERGIFLRNGLLGGEAIVYFDNLKSATMIRRVAPVNGAVQLAFIKGLEKPNVLIELSEPVTVIKGFGRMVTGSVLLLHIDQPEAFVNLLHSHIYPNA